MTNATSICELPDDLRREVLVQLGDVESLKAAAQSCKPFYSTFRAHPSILRLVLEKQISPPLLPYAYAVLKCEREVIAVASDKTKRRLLDTIYDGTTNFDAFFPESNLTWLAALSISSFYQIVQRQTLRATKSALRSIAFESRKFGETERLEIFGPGKVSLSETEALRFYLAFYRTELHFRLFSTTHGSELSPEMDADFFHRLQPWECEQCMIVSDWMCHKAATAVWRLSPGLGTLGHFRCWRLLESDYAIALGLRLFDTMCSTISTPRLRRLPRDYLRDPFAADGVTIFSVRSEEMGLHMRQITEHLDLDATSESTDPDFGPRCAVFAVYTDWRRYYDGPTISANLAAVMGDPYRCRVNSLCYAFWDHGRIADGNMLPFFARIAREQPEGDGEAEDATSEDEIEYDEGGGESESLDGYCSDSNDEYHGQYVLGHQGEIDSDAFSWYSSGGEDEDDSGDEYQDDIETSGGDELGAD